MNKSTYRTVIAIAVTALFSGCSLFQVSNNGEQSSKNVAAPPDASARDCSTGNAMPVNQYYINDSGNKVQSVKIRVTGYGAPPKTFYPDPQRRLMAMRAAKIDAYRSLAERVTGIQIWGGTTIGDMVVEKDRFRVYLDTHLTGARVIAENPQEDGTFETIVELLVGQNFLNDALPATKVGNDCGEPRSNPFRLTKMKHEEVSSQNRAKDLAMSSFYFQKD